jgi:hypothetical protein
MLISNAPFLLPYAFERMAVIRIFKIVISIDMAPWNISTAVRELNGGGDAVQPLAGRVRKRKAMPLLKMNPGSLKSRRKKFC